MKIQVAVCLAMLSCVGRAESGELTIRNETLEVRFDAAANSFSAESGGVTFVRDGQLRESGGEARVASIEDTAFGRGQSIEIAYRGGNSAAIQVFPKAPFVLFRSSLRNGGVEPSVTNKLRPLAFSVDFGAPVTSLQVLGTGGLTDPGNAPGSYMWAAAAEPASRRGVVAGWITSNRGGGVVFPGVREGRVRMEAEIDYGKLLLRPGQSAALETFALGYFSDARFGLEAWADTVARIYRIKLPPQPVGYCTWYHARASNEKDLAAQAAFAAEQLKPFGLEFLQIDDGWQDGIKTNGPKKNFSRVNPS
ncbi:MAG: hypothetical protein ABI165_19920, partial [Bryobacteraceae bacterium]